MLFMLMKAEVQVGFPTALIKCATVCNRVSSEINLARDWPANRPKFAGSSMVPAHLFLLGAAYAVYGKELPTEQQW